MLLLLLSLSLLLFCCCRCFWIHELIDVLFYFLSGVAYWYRWYCIWSIRRLFDENRTWYSIHWMLFCFLFFYIYKKNYFLKKKNKKRLALLAPSEIVFGEGRLSTQTLAILSVINFTIINFFFVFFFFLFFFFVEQYKSIVNVNVECGWTTRRRERSVQRSGGGAVEAHAARSRAPGSVASRVLWRRHCTHACRALHGSRRCCCCCDGGCCSGRRWWRDDRGRTNDRHHHLHHHLLLQWYCVSTPVEHGRRVFDMCCCSARIPLIGLFFQHTKSTLLSQP